MKRYQLLSGAVTMAFLAAAPALAAPRPDSQALIQAVRDGLAPQVDNLLAHRADVNATDPTGATALAWAVMDSSPAMVTRLLKAHADPNLADANGVTPLMLAIDNNAPDTVDQLLAAGASSNVALANGETPLMHAVHQASAQMTAALLAHKADVNARESQFGQSALMWAAGHPALTRMLLDHGADIHVVTKSWQTTSVNYVATTSTLGSTGIPWNNEGEYSGKAGGSTPLIFAAQAGDLESVRMLVAAGADVNEAGADGTTPLLASLYNWSQAGMQVGKVVPMRFAPNVAVANLLLDHGAKVSVSDRAGYTPLHGAVLVLVAGGTGKLPMIGFQAGKLSNVHPQAPNPPRNEAEGLALVARMLDAGADTNKATTNTTPGPVAALRMNPAVAGSTPYHLAAFAHSAKLIDLIAAHGGDPNRLRADGHTPFSLAVMSNDLPVVQSFVEHGADLKRTYDPTDKVANTDPQNAQAYQRKGENILHIAAVPGANFVVEYLAGKGVPLDARNDHGQTPLELAQEQEQFRYMHDLEGPHGVGLEGALKGTVVVRETQTSDAFKRAMHIKTKVASNEPEAKQ